MAHAIKRSGPLELPEASDAPELNPSRVLIVADDAGASEVLRALLFAAGVRGAVEVCPPDRALETMTAGGHELVAIDCDLPRAAAETLVRQLRTLRARSEPTVLVFTAAHEAGKIRTAIRAGVSAIIVKPAAPASLRRRLRALIPQTPAIFLDAV